MIERRSMVLRITVAVVSAAVIGGALAGCSRLADAQQPAAPASTGVTPAPTSSAPSPSTASSGSESSLSQIQSDLDAANSADSNAGGDISAADKAAATSDNG